MRATQNNGNEFEYSITHWFQPIHRLTDQAVIGYEALLRDPTQLHVSPVDIFNDAEKKGCRNILDLSSIKSAIEKFKDQTFLLFLNIFPSTLLDKNFLSWWDEHVPPLLPVVLEILEYEEIMDWNTLQTVIKWLKARGVKIALDDMGAGYSSLRQWIELDPDFIKLDRYFSENLSCSSRKQKTVRSLVDLLSDAAEIIIEGIETREDLNTAKHLGITYAQGYLLGRPTPVGTLLAEG